MEERRGALVRWQEACREDPSAGAILLREVLEFLPSQFQLPETWGASEEDVARMYAQLRKMLAKAILRLLDQDMNRLMQILYRVDVSEARVNAAFQSEFSEIPERLADLIIERQLQKVFTRREHNCTHL